MCNISVIIEGITHSMSSFECITHSIYDTLSVTAHTQCHRERTQCNRTHSKTYGVATISRLLKIIRFFCRIQSLFGGCFALETCNFEEPTNHSHPIRTLYLAHTLLWSWGVCCSVLQCGAVWCSVCTQKLRKRIHKDMPCRESSSRALKSVVNIVLCMNTYA